MMRNNIVVRPMTKKYAPERVRILRQPSVINGVFMEQPVSVEKTELWCDSIIKSTVRTDFVFLEGEAVVGFSGLVNISHKNGTAEFYIFIDNDIQGKGCGRFITNWLLTFAKDELGLRKITLFVTAGNEAALSLYENIGFSLEGTLLKHSWFRGRYVDRLILSIFLDDVNNELNAYEYFHGGV
ncbi:hypothetical protein CBP31_03365 [Oceanisphaera profunda]|uniref:N-acetyltransferase domain-containing protein n=1 Tax=Oceanisphaera profunda TaxID=1416627 RepID=A0A1Y0D3J5_9GAMM|nr:GNAT family protein [Oceanisphaera profunda]ART81776.1 hypothetical protein CBP31_03365 [Oceanisphaera profunda]